jgi:hypothetical protein
MDELDRLEEQLFKRRATIDEFKQLLKGFRSSADLAMP